MTFFNDALYFHNINYNNTFGYTTKEESTDKILVIFMYLCQFIYFSPLDIYDVKNIYPLITTKNDNDTKIFE